MTNPPDRLKDALADRYLLERELGSGGTATVYLAQDLKHGRMVAIKVLRPELAATLGVERFVREIEIAAKLTHPHILPLFDSGEADGFLYYVMPFVAGESLRERLQRDTTIPLSGVLRLTDQIASALHHAHERGVIHRDIKPENVLVADDQAIVADFGIARAIALAGGDKLTGTGLAIGTPSYMSPEQAVADDKVDATADVYALGCVVYEMLAGRPPFVRETAQALLAAHAVDTVPELGTRKADVPATVEQVVRRALAKAPTERFPTAPGFAKALAEATTTEAILAEERRVARRRWTRGAAAAGAGIVLGLGGWWVSVQMRAQPMERLAVLPASNMTRDSAQEYFVDGVHEALVTELQRAGIPIIARQSVLQYRDTEKPIPQIVRELGIDGLIQPAVGREGDSVIVNLALYKGQSDVPAWTGSFPAEVRGVMGLYRDVSRRVADQLGMVLSAQAERRFANQSIVDPRAYEAVLRGQFHYRRFTPEDFDLALQYFEAALAIDSLYAPAYSGIARVWAARTTTPVSIEEAGPIAKAHFARAAELDPTLPEVAFGQAATLVWVDWNLAAGEAAYRRGLELNPNNADGRVFYGHVLMILGRREDAVEQGELAMELDPLNPFIVGLHGMILLGVGQFDEAIRLLEDLFMRNPGVGFGVMPMAGALYAIGREEESLRWRQRYYTTLGDTATANALERGHERGGVRAAWLDAADVLAARRGLSGYVEGNDVAQLYALAGEIEKAIDWLEFALEQHETSMTYIGVIPAFSSLHGHPRFRAIAGRVGVPLGPPQELQ